VVGLSHTVERLLLYLFGRGDARPPLPLRLQVRPKQQPRPYGSSLQKARREPALQVPRATLLGARYEVVVRRGKFSRSAFKKLF
jgi:hypothetical protein